MSLDRVMNAPTPLASPIPGAVYLLALGPAIFLLLAAWFQPFVPVAELMRDPLAVAELSTNCCRVHFGLISSAGVLIWTAGSAICLFAALTLYWNRGSRRDLAFMVSAGLLTGWLALDDLFTVHETVLPALQVPEIVTYAVYAGLGLSYLGGFWRQIIRFRFLMLALGVGFLGLSVGIDIVFHSQNAIRLMIEDGAKFLGIVAWVTFHIEAALGLFATPATRQQAGGEIAQ